MNSETRGPYRNNRHDQDDDDGKINDGTLTRRHSSIHSHSSVAGNDASQSYATSAPSPTTATGTRAAFSDALATPPAILHLPGATRRHRAATPGHVVNNDDVTSSWSLTSCDDVDACSRRNEVSPLIPKNKPQAYARRWYILSLFCMVTLLQGLGWGTFGPITQSCKAVFLWNDNNIAFMALGANGFYIVCSIPFSWLLQRHGLRVSLIISTFLLMAGYGVRCITMYSPWATWTLTIGQILIGGGAVVPFAAVSMLSSLWFPLNQRTTATSIAVLFGFFGLAMGFVVGPLAVPENNTKNTTENITEHIKENVHLIHEQREAIARLLYYEAGFCGAILMLVLIYFPAKPPTPPTLSAHVVRLDTLTGLRSLKSNKQFLLILLAFSIGQGVYGAFSIILDIDVQPIGVSQKTAGWMGFYTTIGGCVTGISISWLSDRFMRRLKCLLFLLLFPMTLALVWFCLLVGSFIPYSEASLYITTIIPGVCGYGATPLFYELACESAYPAGEGITTLILTSVNNFIGCIFLGLLSVPHIGVIWMNYLLVASTVFTILILVFTRVRYHRTDLDIEQIIEPPATSSIEEVANPVV